MSRPDLKSQSNRGIGQGQPCPYREIQLKQVWATYPEKLTPILLNSDSGPSKRSAKFQFGRQDPEE